MSDAADLMVEILKQIRDGVFETKAEVTSLRNQVTYVHQEQVKTNERLETMRGELKEEIADLRRTVLRVARINDETLAVSLENSGRMDALEGRVRTLEAHMEGLVAQR